MAQVADEELKKAFGELHEKMIDTTQKLKLADIQIESLNRMQQRAKLTIAQIDGLDDKTRTYESVGRMFLLDDISSIKSGLVSKISSAEENIAALKNNKSYLERSLKESKNNIREMVQQKQNKEVSN